MARLHKHALAGALVTALAAGVGSATAATNSAPSWALHGSYSPAIHSANFVATVDNRYFPLKPGTGFHYKGVRDATSQTDDMVVTHQTKRILGIRCTVVRDTVPEGGRPVDRTF